MTRSCALWVSPSPKDQAEVKLSSEKGNSRDCGTEEVIWARNWETGVVRIERLTRQECHVYTKQAASELNAWEEVFRKMTRNDFSQLDCGMHGMQLPAGLDVIGKEQDVALGVCGYAVAGGIHR